MVRTQVNSILAESGLDPSESEELTAFLMSLESLVDATAPVPTPALALLLAGGAAGGAANPLTVRRHQNALAAAALAVSAIVSTGVAAAANDLPVPAQRVVAEFSHRFLPFDLPHPEEASEDLVGQTHHMFGRSHDSLQVLGQGSQDGAAQAGGSAHPLSDVDSSDGGDFDDESGDVSPDSQSQVADSGTQATSGDGDVRDVDETSSSGSDGQTTTTTADGTGDTSGEVGGDADPADRTGDSTEAIGD